MQSVPGLLASIVAEGRKGKAIPPNEIICMVLPPTELMTWKLTLLNKTFDP